MGVYIVPNAVTYESNGPSDPDSYSGARVIRMIDHSIPPNPNLASVEQVFSEAKTFNLASESSYWDIDPDAMKKMLIKYDPRGGSHFVVYQNTASSAADNQLVSTLRDYKIAAAALVGGGHHWVCVVGYTTEGQTNNLTGFVIDDPSYSGGGKELAAPLGQWDMAYTAVDGGANWKGKIVEVGDPLPEKLKLKRAPQKPPRDAQTIMSPREAVKYAIEGTRSLFAELPHIKRALEAEPGEPQLVERLDAKNKDYYIVPFQVASSRPANAVGAIAVDARSGVIVSASGADEPYVLWAVTPDEVERLVTERPIPIYEPPNRTAARALKQILRLTSGQTIAADQRTALRNLLTSEFGFAANPRSYLELDRGDFEIQKTWAWAPCGARSLFHPYYAVKTKKLEQQQTIYVNADTGFVQLAFDRCLWRPLGA